MNMKKFLFTLLLFAWLGCYGQRADGNQPKSVSGIYPGLAYYNQEGECGTGAVVPWADRLWVITYGPHKPYGSTDKLYEITPSLQRIIHPESIGGTPADRMIHRESNQLFIGPYAIDAQRHVRVIPVSAAPGRYTGIARSVTDPQNKVVIATMEEGVYEVDVHSLKVNTLFMDGNEMLHRGLSKTFQHNHFPGAHGKGFYSGQGVYVFSNNGEGGNEALVNPRVKSGILAEYDGKEWKTVRRNQFTEVTGPGGIMGNANPSTDPIWSVGWDYRSLILACRDHARWTFYRLPKASNSYDGAHGWNTEWPRIRNVGTEQNPDYLMTMHGMFWKFPSTFTSLNTAGIRPYTSYLKVIGDFTRWGDRLVFGCDDSAQSEFLNRRKAKGGIAGPGQSNSNLWFTSLSQPRHNGVSDAWGSVWQKETIAANAVSEPYLLAGWTNRQVWIANRSDQKVDFILDVDRKGNNRWNTLHTITVQPQSSSCYSVSPKEKGEWVRVKCVQGTNGSVSFVYTDARKRNSGNDTIFNGLAAVGDRQNKLGGLMCDLADDRRALGIVANQTVDGKTSETGYYEMDENLKIEKKTDTYASDYIRTKCTIPGDVVTVDKGSYLIVDDSKRRWRLPLGDEAYSAAMRARQLRLCREVATERDVFNCGGTVYELPAENADGFAKIRPIATHHLAINDYASYRGMLVMTGINPSEIKNNREHIFVSSDGKCAVWAGCIDDLWKLGAPVGHGGPWVDDEVKKGIPSDPYLFAYSNEKVLTVSHCSDKDVVFTMQVDPVGDGDWMTYRDIKVPQGKTVVIRLPETLQGRWVRFIPDTSTKATLFLDYSNK